MRTAIASVCLLLAVSVTAAQAESLVDGDIEAGRTKSMPCSACHGADGNSLSPLWPNLAGQGAPYLAAQLAAFKDGSRENPLMTPQAMALSTEDTADLAAYYESLELAAQAVANPDTIDRGEALWRGGNEKRGVPACIACHGPTGRGNPAAQYPALAGQHAAYTAKQLRDYASGARKSDGKTRMMRVISERLTQDDVEALASYIQGLK